jgi:PadR family transcriptional regulator, regulatory protein PadR
MSSPPTPHPKKGPAKARTAPARASRATKAKPGPAPEKRAFGSNGRDLLTPYVLLAIATRRAHGYLIEQYLNGLGLAKVELTTLYRTLRQLEKEGLVRSTWEAGTEGPARRVYSLTDAGNTWLDAGARFLESYRATIDSFFGAYRSADSRSRKDKTK